MSTLIDLTGKKFGKWTVISKYCYKNKKTYWLCKCECGAQSVVDGDSLRRGKSTGCIKCRKPHYKHHLSYHPLYGVWHSMNQRCKNPNFSEYKNYGGRGISVCKEWETNFLSFYNWAISHGYRKGLSIDRIDNDKGYYPQNCRWITMKAQSYNKSSNHIIIFNGESKTLTEWAKAMGIKTNTLCMRIKSHGTSEALSASQIKKEA